MLESILPFPPETAAAVDEYCRSHSTGVHPMFAEQEAWTIEKFETSQMMSGALQAQFYIFFARDRQAKRVLELGTFTGYSALAWKEGMKDVDGEVWTCEASPRSIEACRTAFQKYDPEGKIHLLEGPAIQTLRCIEEGPFDLIYIDARKAEYIEYFEIILQRNLLAERGIVLVDDTIYKGLVADKNPSNTSSTDPEMEHHLQQASNVHKFNKWALQHPSLEVILLPVFNGLSLVKLKSRKKCDNKIIS